MLQTIGTVALAVLAPPTVPYAALAGAMVVVGVGFTLAVPALTKAVVGSVRPADIGSASGLFSTVRQVGGAFGIAATSAAFTATGGYGTAGDVASGYRAAMLVAAAFATLGLAAALTAPLRRPARATPAARPVSTARNAP